MELFSFSTPPNESLQKANTEVGGSLTTSLETLRAKLDAEIAARAAAEERCATLDAECVSLRAEVLALEQQLASSCSPASRLTDMGPSAKGLAPSVKGLASMDEREAEREALAIIEAEEKADQCTFWFVPTSRLLACRDNDERTLPRFQELRDEGALVQRKLTRSECYRAKYTSKLLAISHR